jgi:hypothetical protein
MTIWSEVVMVPADEWLLKPGGHFLITCTLPIEPVCTGIAHELMKETEVRL